jgi:hypothetical protein
LLDLIEEFRAVRTAFDAAGIEAAVCGGLAVAIHVRPRATVDVDLLLPRPALAAAKHTVRGLGYEIEADPMHFHGDAVEIHRLSKPDPETGDLLSIDLLVVTPALESAWEGRERVGWERREVTVVSRSGLAQMKRLRGSGQDLDDIRDLEAGDGEA